MIRYQLSWGSIYSRQESESIFEGDLLIRGIMRLANRDAFSGSIAGCCLSLDSMRVACGYHLALVLLQWTCHA